MRRRISTSHRYISSRFNKAPSLPSHLQRIFCHPVFALFIIIAAFVLFGIRFIDDINKQIEPITHKDNDDIEVLFQDNNMNNNNNNNELLINNNKPLRITISIATNILPSRMYLFCASYRRWHPINDIENNKIYQLYLFIKHSEEKYLREYQQIAEYFSITLIDFEPIEDILDDKYYELFKIKMKYIKINKRRYFIWFHWLTQFENSDDIDSIFISDANDVKFQGNIFGLYDETINSNRMSLSLNDEIFWFFMENPDVTMAEDKWNSRYIKYCFGNESIAEYSGLRVSCSGTSLGTYYAIYEYLYLINNILIKQSGLFHDCLRKPGDQALHNIILHKDYLLNKNIKIIKIENDMGWILQITTMIENTFWSSKVPKMSDEAIVVHQWKWANSVKIRFEKEYNYPSFCIKQKWEDCTISD